MILSRRAALGAVPGLVVAPERGRAQPAALDPALLSRTLDEAAELPRLHTLLAACGGATVVERVFRGPGPDRPVNIKSASKSVLSALVGIAIGRGVLSGLDQRIAPILGPLVPRDADPRVREITVGHLLSMQAGLERTSGVNYGRWVSSPNWIRFVLTRSFEGEPGGPAMQYSTGSTHLLSAVLTRAARRSTLQLAREWLGGPLGIAVPAWPRDPQGIYFGGNDMLLSPRALLRIGELYRNDGVHGGRRILPAGWVRESWTARVRSPWSGMRYGLGWWVAEARGRPVFFAWGYGGQMLYVVPDLALTVAMTSEPDGPRDPVHQGELHALLADGIVPAAERAGA